MHDAKELEMAESITETNSKKNEIVSLLRKRAKSARRNANIALLFIFFFILTGISIFYFAGDIVIQQSKPVEKFYLR